MIVATGNKVEGVVVYLDAQSGCTRVASCVGNVVCVHFEHDTSSIVVGYDVQVLNSVPWVTDDIPFYYIPRSPELRESLLCPAGVVPFIFIPIRHIIRRVDGSSDNGPFEGSAMDQLLHCFYRNAPYGWLVLYHQLVDVDTLSNPVDVGGKKMRIKKRATRTRRVVGEVVDFGRDSDGIVKLVCRVPPHMTTTSSTMDGLDMKIIGGPYHEVHTSHPDETLFKLAYNDIHDAYDAPALGPQTYTSVLRHLVVDTLQRFRVKTVKYDVAAPDRSEAFFYGFTDDGYHFARNGRMVLNTSTPPVSQPDPQVEGVEFRSHFSNHTWLNLCNSPQGHRHNTIRRGYVIYGRVITKDVAGQTTLQWCCPPPGMDLLRVYLATEGKSPIFRTLTNEDILAKLKDKDGHDTVASDLFQGVLDPNAVNPSIDYIKKEIMWAQ